MSRTVLSKKAVPRASRHSSAASGTGPKRACARPRLGRVHPLIDQLLSLAFEMERQLLGELALDTARCEQRARAQLQSRKFIGGYASFMTRPIAADIRSHSRVSTASWRRPEAVSR